MLDKRRIPNYGWLSSSTSYIILCIIALAFTGCFSLWLFGGFPRITYNTLSSRTVSLGYILLPPGNTSEASQASYSINDLPSGDESNLVDMKNFKFTINHDTCNKSQPLLVTIIHSAPGNFQRRQIVRGTWGKQTPPNIILFLLGYSKEYQNLLEEEDRVYGDLIQGNFIDTYRNMTYKHVMALKWVTYYCPSAKYVLKLDDDVFVHMPAVIDFLKYGLSPWGARRLLLCDPLASTVVKRSWRSKWRVSPREYPYRHYPKYCAGWAIFYSLDTVFLLYREAQREPYFWIDDVHITGILAKKVNITHSSIHSLVLSNMEMRNMLDNPNNSHKDFLFGPPNLSENEIKALHDLVSTKPT